MEHDYLVQRLSKENKLIHSNVDDVYFRIKKENENLTEQEVNDLVVLTLKNQGHKLEMENLKNNDQYISSLLSTLYKGITIEQDKMKTYDEITDYEKVKNKISKVIIGNELNNADYYYDFFNEYYDCDNINTLVINHCTGELYAELTKRKAIDKSISKIKENMILKSIIYDIYSKGINCTNGKYYKKGNKVKLKLRKGKVQFC